MLFTCVSHHIWVSLFVKRYYVDESSDVVNDVFESGNKVITPCWALVGVEYLTDKQKQPSVGLSSTHLFKFAGSIYFRAAFSDEK